jgi:hypothetical protein
MTSGGESGGEMVESHQPVRLVKRKRLQQHTVDDAEDSRRRADPECKREDRHGREPRLLPERADDVPQVVPQASKHVFSRGAECDRQRRMRLPERRHMLRQDISAPEFSERQLHGLIRQRAADDQLAPSVIEVLRELLDDLAFASRREP